MTTLALSPRAVNLESFLPTHDDPERFEPSLRDMATELGRTIGLTGGWASFVEVFAHLSHDERREASMPFTVAMTAARREHARTTGFDLGCDGKPCQRPANVPARFEREFVDGHAAGSVERAEREAEMAAYFAELDAEWETEQWEREYELAAREAGGWWRVHPDMVD